MRPPSRQSKKKAFSDLLARDWSPEDAASVLGLSRATAYRYQATAIRSAQRVLSEVDAYKALVEADAD